MTCRSRVASDPVTPQPRLPRHRYELFFVSPHRHYNLIIMPMGPRLPIALKQEVAMMPIDQTDEVYRSNVGWDLGGIHSMFIVTT